jgi:cell division cycle protein 20 (cofactor of APC complex)
MSYNPKTPTHHRGRSDAKTPLTPSVAGVNSISNISPTKPSNHAARLLHKPSKPSLADTSNPFLLRSSSRPTLPTQTQSSSHLNTPLHLTPSTSLPNRASGARTKSTTRSGTSSTDLTNGGIRRSTSTGPVVNASLRRQASNGVIRKGGVESRMDVITNDYVPPEPKKDGKEHMKRSRSTGSVCHLGVCMRTCS